MHLFYCLRLISEYRQEKIYSLRILCLKKEVICFNNDYFHFIKVIKWLKTISIYAYIIN